MKQRSNSVRLVTSALSGAIPARSEWLPLIELASRGWLVPGLYVAFERAGCLNDVPDFVRGYLALLHDRNAERNRRLRAQLIETLAALNAAAIEPVLLKGAIHLFCGDTATIRSRMISDLDINIVPEQIADAKEALVKLGYRETDNPRELGRSDDVGVIEIHERPHVRSQRYLSGDLGLSAPVVERELVRARVPTPTAHATHLIVHDMIKEGDYWRLTINLRHLHDLSFLARSAEGIDWQRVANTFTDRSGKGALAMQLRALRDLFGVESPSHLRGGFLDKMRHELRLQAAGEGVAGWLLRLAGKLLWGFHRFSESYTWQGCRDLTRRVRWRLACPAKGSTL